MKKIGLKLKLIRESARLKQSDLAKIADVSSNYISMVESGRREPSLKFLEKIAKSMNFPMSAFFWDDIDESKIKDEKLRQYAEDLTNLYWELLKSRIRVVDK